VPGLSNVVAISAGRFHSCALTASGDVFCWGDNSDDQLGTTASTIGPNQVAGLGAGVSAVAAGGAHTCALVAGGGVMCWGRSYEGELGNGQVMTPGTAVPTSPVGLTSGVVAVTAGAAQSCAATSQGAVRCWGASPFGGVSAVPAAVAGLSNVVAVSAEDDLVCALAANGDASCFGRWADSYTHLVTSPAAISGLGSSTTSLVTGGHHACFLSAGGTMKCWGANDHGQLGTGNLTSSESAAVDVLPP
jgi:alpha-tubulin suppressor-like RCC1 family protein